jgi:ABC-type antimicrobial peptide transport system permease subunit
MFFVSYVAAELRRRKGRTILTALGLGVGVALVVAVSALSRGLDRAQDEVLRPLTGLGTDVSVTRPIKLSGSDFRDLSPAERTQLEKENGPQRVGLRNRGKPGTRFSDDNFVSTSQLSFPQSEVAKIAQLDGVTAVAGGLTLTNLHVSGVVPKTQPSGPQVFGGPGGAGNQAAGPRNIDFDARTVSGVDPSRQSLAPISQSSVQKGSWFSAGNAREVILNVSYARRKSLGLGDSLTIKGKRFTVVGIAKPPLGGDSADVYFKLAQLQELAARTGRINTLHVRATSAGVVGRVTREIEATFVGAQVTTAKQLADRIGGSLSDAKSLSSKLGAALEVVGLAAAVLIACLLSLSSVAKRVRELGTLRALGWRQRLVVRQVAGESLAQGALGGVVGALLGVGAAALIAAIGPTLTATVANAAAPAGPGGPGPRGAVALFGQGSIATPGSKTVSLDAPVDVRLIVIAIALALLGGLIAGTAGGLRAARLRPADALRHID